MSNDEIEIFIDQINNCTNLNDLVHIIKPSIFGKDGYIAKLTSQMLLVSNDKKKEFGIALNNARKVLQDAIDQKALILHNAAIDNEIKKDIVDITVPIDNEDFGSIHPITHTINKMINILNKHSFQYITGPEIEEDFFNFEGLNFSKHHPAREMHDTFYLNAKHHDQYLLLRTHTTSVDLRYILENNPTLPLGLASIGKVFRSDSDKTHSQMFYQFEGLMIDSKITMSNLKYYLEIILSEFFNTNNIVIRFRPSYFPFTEPSAEIDIGYSIINNKVVIGGNENFLEILGAGMLHPNVLKNMNIDHTLYQAIAFGGGIERLAMLKYGITDCREFTNSKIDWLKHYTF